MANSYEDGDFTTAEQHGDVVVRRPLFNKDVPGALVIERTMRVNRADYTVTAVGTELPAFTDSRLVEETDFEDLGLGVMEFVQIYATKPDDWTEVIGSEVKEFPGLIDDSSVKKRPPLTRQSPLRVRHEYQIDQSFTFPAIFEVTNNGYVTPYVRGTVTSPTFTNYEASITDGDWLVVRVDPVQYMGDIYDMQIYEVQAQ